MTNKTSKSASPFDSWLEAQRTFWQGWANLASSAMFIQPNADQNQDEVHTKDGSSQTTGIPDISSHWQNLWWQNLEPWTSATAPIARASAEQFFAVQQATLRFLDFSTRAWQAIAPGETTSDDLESALRHEGQQVVDEMSKLPEDFSAAVGDLSRLWETYINQWQSFGQPWFNAMQASPEFLAQASSGDSNGWIELSNLYRQAYQETFGQLVTSPNLGPTRELNEKLLRGFDTWVDWQMAVFDYQSIMMETWKEAIDDYMQALVTMAEKGEKIHSVRELILLWTRGAEKIFTRAFRTERYVLAQGRMLNTAMEQRSRQREILEVYLQALDLPTRSELDETHRRIYELRKEVKALRKELQILKTQEIGKDASTKAAQKTRKRKTVETKPDQADKAGGNK